MRLPCRYRYRWWALLLPVHEHDWRTIDGNAYKRKCTRCPREEWMMWKQFPSTDEPSLVWRVMHE